MDIYSRFNRKNIDDLQIDTLIGLSKGLIADGKVDQIEAEILMTWLMQNREATSHPIILNLLNTVSSLLEDGVLDADESAELLSALRTVSGTKSELQGFANATSLPLDYPPPMVTFPDQSFLFTGTCAFGTRRQCQEATAALGGENALRVTKSLDYLVLGAYVTDTWQDEVFGERIKKAMQFRDDTVGLAIISEEHWANSGNLRA